MPIMTLIERFLVHQWVRKSEPPTLHLGDLFFKILLYNTQVQDHDDEKHFMVEISLPSYFIKMF